MPRVDFLSDLWRPRRRASQGSSEAKPSTLRAKRSIIAIIAPHPRHVSFPEKCVEDDPSRAIPVNKARQDRKRPAPLEWKLYKSPSLYSFSGPSEETLVPASPVLSRSPSSSTSHGSSGPSTPRSSSSSHTLQTPPPSPLRHAISSYFRRDTEASAPKTLRLHDECESLDHSLVTLEAGLASLRRRRSLLEYERSSSRASRPTSLASLTESREISALLPVQQSPSGNLNAEATVEPDPFARDGTSLLEPRKPVMGDVYDISAYLSPFQGSKWPIYEDWVRDMHSRASMDHKPVFPGQKSIPSVFPSSIAPTRKMVAQPTRPRARTVSAPSTPRHAVVRHAKSLPPIPDEDFEGGGYEVAVATAPCQGPSIRSRVAYGTQNERSLHRQIDELMTPTPVTYMYVVDS